METSNEIISLISDLLDKEGLDYAVNLDLKPQIKKIVNIINQTPNNNNLIQLLKPVVLYSFEHESIVSDIINLELLNKSFYEENSFLLESSGQLFGLESGVMDNQSYFDKKMYEAQKSSNYVQEILPESIKSLKFEIPENVFYWIENDLKNLPIENYNTLILFMHKKKFE